MRAEPYGFTGCRRCSVRSAPCLGTYWCALAFVSRRAAMLAALMMVASAILGVEARLAKTDAMLLFTVVFAMGALARVYLPAREANAARPSLGLLAIFWTAVAAGVLIKGLSILMVVGLTTADALGPRPLLALGAAASPVSRNCLGGSSRLALAGRHLHARRRCVSSQFRGSRHAGQIGEFAAGPRPAARLLPRAVLFDFLSRVRLDGNYGVRRSYPGGGEPAIRFLLAWLVPSWIVFELAVTKLPHYVLPLYPAIAILFAMAMERNMLSHWIWFVRSAVWWFLAPLIVSIVLVAGAIVIGHEPVLPHGRSSLPRSFAACWPGDCTGRRRRAGARVRHGGFGADRGRGLAASSFRRLARCSRARRSCASCMSPVARIRSPPPPDTRSRALYSSPGPRPGSSMPASAADFLQQGSCRFAFIEDAPASKPLRRAPKRSVCNMIAGRASRHSISAAWSGSSIAVFQSKDER